MNKQRWLQATTSLCLAATLLMGTVGFAQTVPDKAQESYKQGQQAYQAGKLDEALGFFRAATTVNPSHTDAFYNLGAISYQQRNYPEAMKAFNRVLELNPNDHMARYNLGLVYERLQQLEKARAAFELIPISSARYEDAQKHLTALRQNRTLENTAANAKPAQPATQTQPAVQEPVDPDQPQQAIQIQELANGFYGPTGLVIGRDGNLYVANFSKNSIYKVNSRGEKTLFASGTGINGPVGLTADPITGDLYVANHLNNTVTKIGTDGKLTVIAKDLKKPYNIFFHQPTRTLYVSQQETNSIAKIKLN